ncbi:MAG: response regulator transcription factor [Betaproteobacteria bacterium]|jgi:DNA-binding NarL/FixJ family response regulator|nr:response regulator transcription factor [Betaproteobacteria bacterium]
MKNKVLIVEDHHLLRQGLCSMVGALPDFEVVGEAKDGKEAVRQAAALQPDVILMDLSLPRMTGIDATIQIKTRMPRIRIVALTAFKTEEYVHEALRAGVDGYVMKDTSYEELMSALRSVMAGKKFLSPDVSGHLVNTFLHRGEPQRPASPWEKLTARERGILKLIAEGRTNRSAAEFLNVSPKTVEKHRGNLMRKLGLGNVCELTLAALETGLIERPAPVARLFANGNGSAAPGGGADHGTAPAQKGDQGGDGLEKPGPGDTMPPAGQLP